MPRRLIGAHICFLSLVLAAAATGQANRHKACRGVGTVIVQEERLG